ncbi:MAG: GTP-binding protein [Candidatus Baldrarchaeota archaeon]
MTEGYLFKVIVVGDAGVGKTSLTIRFAHGYFIDSYLMTIGVDLYTKNVDLGIGKPIKLQIWDTGGQERFKKLRPLYYKGAAGGLLVYDITNKNSFKHLKNWFNEVQKYCGKIPLILVGNKVDLIKNRKVSVAEEKRLAESFKIPHYRTSAKTGENVNDVFLKLAKFIYETSIGGTNI